VRRKFYDVHVSLASPIALEALERIGRLYRIEEELRGLPPCAAKKLSAFDAMLAFLMSRCFQRPPLGPREVGWRLTGSTSDRL